MMMDWFYILHGIKNWSRNEEATALVEAALLFPPMIAVLMGVFDLGNGILLGQKTITSSQIAADLTARDRTVNSAEVEEIIDAAQLAFEPFKLSEFGIDIVSVTFNATQQPVVLWRVTRDMLPNTEAVASVSGLAPSGEGMVIVTVQYSYLPFFSNYFMGNFNFQEVAFARGRRSPTVTWE